MTKVVSMTFPDGFHEKFKEYCKSNGYTVSGRVKILILKDMENGK